MLKKTYLDDQIDDNIGSLLELLQTYDFIDTIDYSCSGHISIREEKLEFNLRNPITHEFVDICGDQAMILSGMYFFCS